MPGDPKDIRSLRQRAEKLLSEAPEKLALMSGTDVQKLVHELSVYQIELEMQNEELRTSQERLEESRTEYAELYDSAPLGYLTFDTAGLITRANLTACGLLGSERSRFVKKPFTLFVHPESQDTFYSHLRKVLETTTRQTCQLVLKRNGGSLFDAQLESIAVQGNGQPVVNVIVTDITERTRLEAQLRQSHKMEALGTMAGGIAHDFNNILAAIIGFTELVASHMAKESRDQHHLRRVMEASVRGRELVRQLLTFSRNTEQEKRLLRVDSIIKESVKLLRASMPSTIGMTVKVTCEPCLILADPVQIQQILINLCTNASYAMREKGGSLGIELSDVSVSPSDANPYAIEPGLYVKLLVRDTGTGIPAHIKDSIFDPFFTTKAVGEGTGLGLSVVMGIVKQSGGYITMESELGKGSTFAVYFPKVTGELVADTAGGQETLPTGYERILFVDDEEALVEMGEEILAELGYDVTSRMNGREALALFRLDPSRFDLVISDQTMPELTGIDLAKEIMVIRPDMRVILCTGFSYLVDADGAKAAGIRAFLMKPLTKREIAKTIRKVLDE